MKRVLLLTALLLLGVTVNAQGFRWGGSAGVNMSNVTGDDVQDNDARFGLNIGAVASINVAESFDVQPEVRFSMRGWKEGDFKINLNYVDVPVVADYEVLPGLSLQGGPLFGFNVSKNAEFDGNEIEGAAKDEFFSDFNDINFGAAVGAQYEFDNGLFLQARYDMGFNDHFDEFDAAPCNISLTLGILLVTAAAVAAD